MNPVEIAVWLLLLALSLINGAVESVGWTPTPVPAETGAETAPVASGAILDGPTVYQIALSVSGSHGWAAEAVEVIRCESRFRVHVWGDGGRAYGLMQVHARWHGRVPETARGQIEQGYRIWSASRSWRLWSCKP